ncbi:hypothetical protein [Arthrobacter sp. L77]|uniref:hypothetical protein n=1 Tax=Arthrobacter sp. L77 TaxID=1496689 RepID=UPI0012E03511|nr:hypothetical protein [Arthrobacter sp. L77]
MDRLANRMVGLTDLRGAPLYVIPEAQTRTYLETLEKPPPAEEYTPSECAPDTPLPLPPADLEAAIGRNDFDDDVDLIVEIFTAPDAEGLAAYLIGTDPESPPRCMDFSVATAAFTHDVSYTSVESVPIGDRASSLRYSTTQYGSTTHHLRVTALNGPLAASILLSTVEPADQTMTDAVLRLTQQAVS